MTWYMVFVQEANGGGTTHVSAHNVDNVEQAIRVAVDETCDDWSRDDYEDCDLRVLGVLEGLPEIRAWSDYGIDEEIEIPPPDPEEDE